MPTCARCGTTCADGQRFCGSCGAPLDAGLDVAKLVDERLTARLEDQKLVEMETAQAVVARIGEWTKLFGFFVAFPLGILVIVLTILGFRQYSDLVRTVQSSKQDFLKQVGEIQSQLADAAHAGQSARAEGQKLNQEIAEIRKTLDLTQAAKIRGELEQLSARVTGIESRFKISSPGVSTALERSLTAALSPSMVLWPYAQHLMTLENKVVIPSNDGPRPALTNAIPDYFVASHLNEPRLAAGSLVPPKAICATPTTSASSIPK